MSLDEHSHGHIIQAKWPPAILGWSTPLRFRLKWTTLMWWCRPFAVSIRCDRLNEFKRVGATNKLVRGRKQP